MHTIQFNAFLQKRRRLENNTDSWMRYAESDPQGFAKAIGFPKAKVLLDTNKRSITVKEGVNVVAYYNKKDMHDPVYVTSKGVFPMNMLIRCGAPPITVCPFGEDEQNVADDVVPHVLQYLGVSDACAMGMTCWKWNRIIRSNTAFWERHCNKMGIKAALVPGAARSACLWMTMHGFTHHHSTQFRNALCSPAFYRCATWIFSAFLKRQVTRIRIRSPGLFPGIQNTGPRAFVVVTTTRDFNALFLFDDTGLVLWKLNGTHTWNYCKEESLVQTYQQWIESCLVH